MKKGGGGRGGTLQKINIGAGQRSQSESPFSSVLMEEKQLALESCLSLDGCKHESGRDGGQREVGSERRESQEKEPRFPPQSFVPA